jgi:hypothetical protein
MGLADIGLAHPLGHRHRVDTEIGGDLLDRHTVVAVASDPNDVVTQLSGIGPGHNDILPAHPSWASQLRCHPIRAADPNVVTSWNFHYTESRGDNLTARLETACETGRSAVDGTGVHPASWSSDWS